MKNALILATLTALISIAIGTSSTAHADGTTPPAAAFHSGPQPGHEPASGRASGAAASMSAGTVVSGASVVNAERPAVCGEPCAQFGTVSFEHPTWGTSKLIVEGAADGLGICFFTVVDAAGTPRWEKTGVACTNGNGSVFTPAPDKAGNILIQYGTMRYSGVTVLRPVTDGIDDFGSLPSDGSDPNTDTDRFANSVAYDVDGDGTFEIVSVGNSCEPGCADRARRISEPTGGRAKTSSPNCAPWSRGHRYRSRRHRRLAAPLSATSHRVRARSRRAASTNGTAIDRG